VIVRHYSGAHEHLGAGCGQQARDRRAHYDGFHQLFSFRVFYKGRYAFEQSIAQLFLF
jgi:hypothetical protein